MSQTNNPQETAVLIQELEKLFAEPADATSIADIQKKASDIEKLQVKRQADAKKLIKEFSQRTEQLQTELSRKDGGNDDRRARLETLARQKENLVANITTYDKQLQQLRSEIEELKRRTDQVKAHRTQLDSQRLDDAPRLKLYQCVSNIKWDYETPARIKGHVDIVDHKRQLVKDVRPFDIDPTQHTAFEITNQLWDLMD